MVHIAYLVNISMIIPERFDNWSFICLKLNPLYPRMLVSRFIEIGSVVLEKTILKFRQ